MCGVCSGSDVVVRAEVTPETYCDCEEENIGDVRSLLAMCASGLDSKICSISPAQGACKENNLSLLNP